MLTLVHISPSHHNTINSQHISPSQHHTISTPHHLTISTSL
ncbi:MAG: hypothetical protein SOY53_04480 [Prevotella sp.]|nr:hypothetical protein [Leyella stercorea]MDY4088676.1 hypothetical protein [Prevotella sp.]MDY4244323.1 hypothetical protein [Prevotella sp.]MDY4440727.1 hypothetical protein [Prevotella sp.]MDY5471317.1 hypothetical protein [Prevotella sp.]